MGTLPAPFFVPSSPASEVWLLHNHLDGLSRRNTMTWMFPTQAAKEETKGITKRLAEMEAATPSTKRVSRVWKCSGVQENCTFWGGKKLMMAISGFDWTNWKTTGLCLGLYVWCPCSLEHYYFRINRTIRISLSSDHFCMYDVQSLWGNMRRVFCPRLHNHVRHPLFKSGVYILTFISILVFIKNCHF